MIVVLDDADGVVLDPCYRDTEIEDAPTCLNVPIEWHEGRSLHVTQLDQHVNFCGQEATQLGHHIAQGGLLTARIVGDAAQPGRYDPQTLKKVWHLVAQFGTPTT